ncbi:MAG: choice-of-anchor L domain-containing protein [Bacteroidota bacterium]|jgi:hypothetical protein
MFKRKKCISLFFLLICALSGKAQLTITDSLNFSSIASLLQGFGTNISNTVYNCDSSSVAQFSGISELPNNNGLLLTTGFADSLAHTSGYFCSGVMNGGVTNDLDMNTLAGFLPTYDGCILEFDCVPLGDTLLFNYTFGSEEYPEFVGQGFNDAFGIFLTGPGYANVNIATIPGTSTPVTVNNINSNINASFYYDNVLGQHCALDGFTLSLTSTTVVTPNQTYHFKIGVADASDQIFDTGVFLEAFSFRSNLSTGDPNIAELNEVAFLNDENNRKIVFNFKRATSRNATLEIYESGGKKIHSETIPSGCFSHFLQSENFTPGIYFVILKGECGVNKTFKFAVRN